LKLLHEKAKQEIVAPAEQPNETYSAEIPGFLRKSSFVT
jgi:hypothetical protein